MQTITNLSTYKFVNLSDTVAVQAQIRSLCQRLHLLGTILIAEEGINIMLAGHDIDIQEFIRCMDSDPRFTALPNKLSYSEQIPYEKLCIKIKKEIITFHQDDIDPARDTVPHLSPKTLQEWLAQAHDFVLLDTRNDFEIDYGTFDKAEHLDIQVFTEFTDKLEQCPEEWKHKPVVIFCTGGVRCEKAGPLMRRKGFEQVYQLDGGILNYFAECEGDGYQGNCFVFDDRIALDPNLEVA